ncbi:hypothetical protein ATG66_2687 [Vibrio sp. ES.051]|nr:hypothetical protein ATG66_2687 [Vibrio sp. ES.051]
MPQSSLSTSTFASETAKQNHNIKNRTQLQQATPRQKSSTIAQFISLEISALAAFLTLATNAQLSSPKRPSPPSALRRKH